MRFVFLILCDCLSKILAECSSVSLFLPVARNCSDGFDTTDWTIYGLFTHPRPSPAKSCYALSQQNPKPPNGVYTLIAQDGGLYDAYCDISGGGWTRVYHNTFFSNHHGITYNIDCPCGANAGMNNGARALDGND